MAPMREEAVAALVRRLPRFRGKWAIAMRYYERARVTGELGGALAVKLGDGTVYQLPRASQMSWAVAFEGGWDRHFEPIWRPHVEAGSLLLDVGASLGLWTVPLGRAAQAVGAHVWAFEPHPRNKQWLAANVTANALDDVVSLRPVALGDAAGIVHMDDGEAETYGAGNAAIATLPGRRGSEVEVVRFDDLERERRVSFVKIDVEGYEIRALRGAMGMIAADRPVILGEFNPDWVRDRGEDLAGFLAELRQLGYRTFELRTSRRRPWLPALEAKLERVDGAGSGGELLCLPR
jgi:FkbM family methyltransferase